METLNSWVKEQLHAIFSSALDITYAEYLMTLTSEEDITEFCKDLFGDKWNEQAKNFVSEFMKKKIRLQSSLSSSEQSDIKSDDFRNVPSLLLAGTEAIDNSTRHSNSNTNNSSHCIGDRITEFSSSKGMTMIAYVKPSHEADYMPGQSGLSKKTRESGTLSALSLREIRIIINSNSEYVLKNCIPLNSHDF